MDSIHPPCEVQFFRRAFRADRRGDRHHPDRDDGEDDYLSDSSNRSPLSSPPNSPLQLSPCTETRREARGKDHHSHDGKIDNHRNDVHGGGDDDDRPHRFSSPLAGGEPPVPSLMLPSPRASTAAFRNNSRDEPMAAQISRLASLSSASQSAMGNSSSRLGGGHRVDGRLVLGGDEQLEQQQQQQQNDDENLGAPVSRTNHPLAPASSVLATKPRRIESNLPGASNSKHNEIDRDHEREHHRVHNSREEGSRVNNGRFSALPFEDEDTTCIEDAGLSIGPVRVLAAVPPAIDEFPSLDEDDDDAAVVGIGGDEIVAAPTDEGPSFLSPVSAVEAATKASAPASSSTTAGPWISFHRLKQRVIDAVSPIPPPAMIEGPGDDAVPDTAAEPYEDSACRHRSVLEADEPPSLSRRTVAAADAQRHKRSAAYDGSPMHPMDERDELQSFDVQIKQDPEEPLGHWSAPVSGAVTLGCNSMSSEVWASRTPAPGRLDAAAVLPTALVTPPHPTSALAPAGVARKPTSGLPVAAHRVAIKTPLSSHGVNKITPAETPSPVIVSPPQPSNQEKIGAGGSNPTLKWEVTAGGDSSYDAPNANLSNQARSGWWVEDELSKREQQRKLAGDMTQLSVAERIAALNLKIEASSTTSSCSQPSSPECPSERKSPSNSKIASFSSASHTRRTTTRLEPPGSDGATTSTASSEKLSIVGVSSPPPMKRLNDSFESVVRPDDNRSLPSRSSRTGKDFCDANDEQPRDLTESSECFHDHDLESSNSLIASLDSMVRDMENCTARKASLSSTVYGMPQNLHVTTSTSATRKTTAQQKDSFARGTDITIVESASSTDASLASTAPVAQATGINIGMSLLPKSHAPSARHRTEKPAVESSCGLDDVDSFSEVTMPFLVKPLDSELGVPKGDVMVSLLSKDSSWSSNITEAVWRCRTMRRNNDTKWLKENAKRRSSPLVKTGMSLVVGTRGDRSEIKSPNANQFEAIEHLKFDELDEALQLYEDIHRSYDKFFAQEIEQSASKSPKHRQHDVTTFKLFAGQAFHNIATIKLLQGEYFDALTFFERATLNRASSCGTGHPDHISSLVRMALCHFALENFASSQAELEEALAFLRGKKCTIAEYRQLAEVLNNLGCLSYMFGRIEMAISYLEESLDLQGRIAEQSLYIGSRFSCHNGTLNATITKGNLGLLALATGDPSMSITAFEASLRDQQLLLRDAHVTLLATIEHLAIAHQISGNKDRALQLLRRMLHMQIDAYGPDDERSVSTGEKITNLLLDKDNESLIRSPRPSFVQAGQTNGKFRPFSLIRKRHSKAS